MSPAPSPRPGLLAGLVLLACWLGWITATFAAIGARPEGDATILAATLLAVADDIPVALDGMPMAIRLTNEKCDCAQLEQQWQRVGASMTPFGGRTLSLPAPDVDADVDAPELLVLAADGSAVYAGPMSPPPAVCGSSADALAQWLPVLLSATDAPLHLPSRCSC